MQNFIFHGKNCTKIWPLRWACEKIAQNVAQHIFVCLNTYIFPVANPTFENYKASVIKSYSVST
jgi:hypothetical protein